MVFEIKIVRFYHFLAFSILFWYNKIQRCEALLLDLAALHKGVLQSSRALFSSGGIELWLWATRSFGNCWLTRIWKRKICARKRALARRPSRKWVETVMLRRKYFWKFARHWTAAWKILWKLCRIRVKTHDKVRIMGQPIWYDNNELPRNILLIRSIKAISATSAEPLLPKAWRSANRLTAALTALPAGRPATSRYWSICGQSTKREDST